MFSNGFFKRFLPFFATFALGLVIASLLGGFSGRRFGRGHHREDHRQYDIEMRDYVNQLKTENRELRQQLGSSATTSEINVIGAVPAPPIAPVAPVAPAHRNHR